MGNKLLYDEKMANGKKSKKITKSLRMKIEDIEMIDAGATSRNMTFSDFITYCVRKELIGSNGASPELLTNLAENLTILKKTIENAESLCYTMKNGAEYELSYSITENIRRQEEEERRDKLDKWMKSAVSMIKTSNNPQSMCKSLIDEGMRSLNLTDYAISILENTANSKIPIRKEV